MNLISFLCSSSSSANALKADADTGNLWGVDLGTTTKSEAVGKRLVIYCTETRGAALFSAAEARQQIASLSPPALTKMDPVCAMFYALGKMDS